jgi:ssDNA-binding Zn-finger/Zn-ribbon topoisomerase 1
MAEKISKTARASLGDKGQTHAHMCPQCGTSMVATKVIKHRNTPGGMFWVCPKDDNRVKI